MRATSRGFTLLEVLIALVIGAMLALVAGRTASFVMQTNGRMQAAAEEQDRAMNAERWLREALRLTSASPQAEFVGLPAMLESNALIRTGDGWWEPARLRIAVEAGSLVGRMRDERLVLRTGVRGVEMDYLIEPGADSRWVNTWLSSSATPVAVRLRLRRDTPATQEVADTLLLRLAAAP